MVASDAKEVLDTKQSAYVLGAGVHVCAEIITCGYGHSQLTPYL